MIRVARLGACLAASVLLAAPAGAQEARGWARPPGPSPEQVGLLFPRLLLAPPRFVLGGVFWPIRHGLRQAERHSIGALGQGTGSDEQGSLAVLPFLAHESELGPSIGVRVRRDRLAGHDEVATADARFFGRYTQAYRVAFDGSRVLGSRLWLESSAAWKDEPHLLFAGLGDPPGGAAPSRMHQQTLHSKLRAGYTIGGDRERTQLGATAFLTDRRVGPSDDAPSIERIYDVSRLPGYGQRTNSVELTSNLVVDTLDAPGSPSRGVHLEAFGGGVPGNRYRYGHYGGELTVYVDLYRRTRVLVLRASHEAVARARTESIPFADLPRLGGPDRLRGYELGRFRDEKTMAGTIEYRYPIHEILAGCVFADVGRVAPTYRALSVIEDWRVGGGGGLLIRTRQRALARLDLAYGDGLHVYLTTDPIRAFSDRDIL